MVLIPLYRLHILRTTSSNWILSLDVWSELAFETTNNYTSNFHNTYTSHPNWALKDQTSRPSHLELGLKLLPQSPMAMDMTSSLVPCSTQRRTPSGNRHLREKNPYLRGQHTDKKKVKNVQKKKSTHCYASQHNLNQCFGRKFQNLTKL